MTKGQLQPFALRGFGLIFAVWIAGVAGTGCAYSRRPVVNPIAARMQRIERCESAIRRSVTTPKSAGRALAEYDESVANFVSILRERLTHSGMGALTNGGLRVDDYLLNIRRETEFGTSFRLGDFDHFHRAEPRHEKGIFHQFVRLGIGTALVGEQGQSIQFESYRHQFYSQRIYRPVTAIVSMGDKQPGIPRSVELSLLDPNGSEATPSESLRGSLTADFPAAERLGLAREAFIKSAWLGLLWPGLHLEESGLFLLEPYQPEKIPVVLVHGLYSSPATWVEIASAIHADPNLSRKFQIWYFIYPSGLPIPNSAQALRKCLNKRLDQVDPGLRNPTSHQLVLIGHSMGGLLSRLQVVDSGERFWTNYFSRSLDKMILSDSSRAELSASFYFQRQPSISRLIFIATPHKGSSLADLWLSRWFVRLIHLPSETVKTVTELSSLNLDAIRPDVLHYKTMCSTSIESLSPGNPLFRALEECPPPVPYHSIIASHGRLSNIPVSDGVVPFSSSHIRGAQSELILSDRHACTDNNSAIEEVKCILNTHWMEMQMRSGSLAGREH